MENVVHEFSISFVERGRRFNSRLEYDNTKSAWFGTYDGSAYKDMGYFSFLLVREERFGGWNIEQDFDRIF